MTDTLWQRSDEWVGTEVEDSFVMIHLGTGTYLTLNRTANAVWSAMETPRTRAAIEEEMAARFDVDPAECREEVGGLLARMHELKLAAPVGSGSARGG